MIPLMTILPPLARISGAVVLAIAVIGGGWWIKNKVTEYQVLKTNNETLTQVVEIQKQTLESQKIDFETIREVNNQQQSLNDKLLKEVRSIHKAFNESKSGKQRDIGKLATKKTKLIENIVNKGTKKTFDCLEELTNNESDNTSCDTASN